MKKITNDDIDFNYSLDLFKRKVSSEDEKIEFLTGGMDTLECPYELDKSLNTKFELNLLYTHSDSNRPGVKFKTTNPYIVIHEVYMLLERERKDRNLGYYKNLIRNDNIIGLLNPKCGQVGYHFLCDDDKIACFIPWDEISYHSGSGINKLSIGIERLVHENVNFPDALHNQAKLAATLMYINNIPLRRVITHYDATIADTGRKIKKMCPSRMLAGEYGGINAFYVDIVYCLRNGDLFLKELEEVKRKIEIEDKKDLNKLEILRDYVKNNNDIDIRLLKIIKLALESGIITDNILKMTEEYYKIIKLEEENSTNKMVTNLKRKKL